MNKSDIVKNILNDDVYTEAKKIKTDFVLLCEKVLCHEDHNIDDDLITLITSSIFIASEIFLYKKLFLSMIEMLPKEVIEDIMLTADELAEDAFNDEYEEKN